jgi:hypothetical protein
VWHRVKGGTGCWGDDAPLRTNHPYPHLHPPHSLGAYFGNGAGVFSFEHTRHTHTHILARRRRQSEWLLVSDAMRCDVMRECRDFLPFLPTPSRPPTRPTDASQMGVDDRSLPWFREVKVAAARAVVSEGGVRAAADFAVFGVPHGVRAAVWETALGLRRPPGMRPPGAASGGVGRASGFRSRSGTGSGSGSGAWECGDGFGSSEEEMFERLCTQVGR